MPATFETQLFTLKKGDLGRPIEAILEDPDTGTPRNLADCTVEFRMKNVALGVVRTGDAEVIGADSSGHVRYSFTADDVAAAGELRCEWVVTDYLSKPTTYPSEGFTSVFVTDTAA